MMRSKAWNPVYAGIDPAPISKNEDKGVAAITHPEYDANIFNWEKYRLTFEGGKRFIDAYLKAFSAREDTVDFNNRREITYAPAHAKSAIMDIKNSIFQRLVDITRTSGPLTYQNAITGEGAGVDLQGNSMNSFIGRVVLPELLSMGKVGIFIDKVFQPQKISKAQANLFSPYIYHYQTEDIRSWTYDTNNMLISLLLRDYINDIDPQTGLTNNQVEGFRLLRLTDNGVLVQFFDLDGAEHHDARTLLNLPAIPFVIMQLTASILVDVADYQIALLNLGSSDINYALKANYPFYTEQYNPNSELPYLRTAQSEQQSLEGPQGQAAQASEADTRDLKVGVTKGRRYAKDVERPDFIHPSSEPIKASMDKQEQLKKEIRELVNLALNDVRSASASAESKKIDERGLEAGLSYIGMELEIGERLIAKHWANYEGRAEPAVIKYPQQYSLRTDKERREEAKELGEIRATVPSVSYQKEVTKEMARITVGPRVSSAKMREIENEIDTAIVIVTNPDVIMVDHQEGLVSTETASKARLYPDGEVEQAKKDRAERAAAIALAQSKAAQRGVADLDSDPSNNPKPLDSKQRGNAKGGE